MLFYNWMRTKPAVSLELSDPGEVRGNLIWQLVSNMQRPLWAPTASRDGMNRWQNRWHWGACPKWTWPTLSTDRLRAPSSTRRRRESTSFPAGKCTAVPTIGMRRRTRFGNKQLAVGAVDFQDANVESVDAIAERITKYRWLLPEQTLITTSCGLNHLPRHIAFDKLRARRRQSISWGIGRKGVSRPSRQNGPDQFDHLRGVLTFLDAVVGPAGIGELQEFPFLLGREQ